MILLFALLIPLSIGLVAFAISGRRITPKELALSNIALLDALYGATIWAPCPGRERKP